MGIKILDIDQELLSMMVNDMRKEFGSSIGIKFFPKKEHSIEISIGLNTYQFREYNTAHGFILGTRDMNRFHKRGSDES